MNTSTKKCNVESCSIEVKSRGLCSTHYTRFYRGDYSLPANPTTRVGYDPICVVEGCESKRSWQAYCSNHKRRMDRHGSTDKVPRKTLEERFWPKVDKRGEDECWPWLASLNHAGYGQFSGWGSMTSAHKVSYRLAYGIKLTSRQHLHHICAVKECVNPKHLQRVTPAENNAEMRERLFYKKRIEYLENLLASNGIPYAG